MNQGCFVPLFKSSPISISIAESLEFCIYVYYGRLNHGAAKPALTFVNPTAHFMVFEVSYGIEEEGRMFVISRICPRRNVRLNYRRIESIDLLQRLILI